MKNMGVDNFFYGFGVVVYWCGFFNLLINLIIFVIRNDCFCEGYCDIFSIVWYGL